MTSDGTGKAKKTNEMRVELKYCEGCGGLGIRECGAGQVYCNRCAAKMEELAVARKASRHPSLPVGKRSLLDDAANTNAHDFGEKGWGEHDFEDLSFEDDAGHFDDDDFDRNELDCNDLDATAWIAGGAA